MQNLFNRLDMIAAVLSSQYRVRYKMWRPVRAVTDMPDGTFSVLLRVESADNTFGFDVHGYVSSGPHLHASGLWDPKQIWLLERAYFRLGPG